MASPIVVAFANFKGGSGKTTSAAFLAHALHEQGRRVLVIDGDPLRVLASWEGVSADPWPFPVIEAASESLHKDVPGLSRGYDVVVIDTPGNVVQKGITRSAMQAATHVIVPIAPSRLEEMLLNDVVSLVNEASQSREGGRPPRVLLLLNRAVANTNLLAVYREHYPKYGLAVFPEVVTSRQLFVAAAGENITRASETPYGDLAHYLMEGGKH